MKVRKMRETMEHMLGRQVRYPTQRHNRAQVRRIKPTPGDRWVFAGEATFLTKRVTK